jgi:hypothetical protein
LAAGSLQDVDAFAPGVSPGQAFEPATAGVLRTMITATIALIAPLSDIEHDVGAPGPLLQWAVAEKALAGAR